jgi:hypothetical protein
VSLKKIGHGKAFAVYFSRPVRIQSARFPNFPISRMSISAVGANFSRSAFESCLPDASPARTATSEKSRV